MPLHLELRGTLWAALGLTSCVCSPSGAPSSHEGSPAVDRSVAPCPTDRPSLTSREQFGHLGDGTYGGEVTYCFTPEGKVCEAHTTGDLLDRLLTFFPAKDANDHGYLVDAKVTCGPVLRDETCCWTLRPGYDSTEVGRPLVIDGQRRRALPGRHGGWSLSHEARSSAPRGVAEGWIAQALAEHASIASFARFTLDLMALGAPSVMVAEAIRAQLDEVRHARRCFGVAEAFGAVGLGPGPLDTRGASGRTDAGAVLVDLIREGCVHETLAAHEAAALVDRVDDSAVAEVLREIAADEARHAALAWRTVQWILAGHPELAGRACDVFQEALRAPHPAPPGPELARWGLAGPGLRAALAETCRREVVAPTAAALLAARRAA